MRKTLLASLVALVSISALSACGSTPSASADDKVPTSLIGDWHQTSGNPSAVMKATITPGAIQINMKTRDSTNVYWLGTFDTDKNVNGSFETVSIADQDAMQNMIFASTDKTKKFSYEDGDLSYEFSIMGTTTTVHLAKK